MAGTYNSDTNYLVTGTVSKVDEAAGTCDVDAITGSATTEIQGVELQTVVSDGLLIIPKIGSEVKVLFSKYTTPFIVQYSEVEKMYLSGTLIQFNDGKLGGLVTVNELVNKLNALENKLNSIITWGATVTPPLVTTPLIPTVRDEIENTIITQ